MRGDKKITILIHEIDSAISVIDRIDSYYKNYLKEKSIIFCQNTEQAIIVSEVIANVYTCLETVFLRVSQFFENEIRRDKWHQDLLDKMTLRIDGVREAVITQKTHQILLEFLKFRHFKRYYFEFNYDLDKIEFLQKKYTELKPRIKKELDDFIVFLQKLRD